VAAAERVYLGSRLKKLGARAGMRVMVVDIDDLSFVAELKEDGVEILTGPRATPDMLFLGVHSVADLRKIATYKKRIPRNGTLWLVRPKGKDTPVSERDAMDAGLDAGLVDVKVVSFSDTHSALKYVYRLVDR
jgi:hypothetical protein